MNTIERYPNLFKPIKLGNTYFRNRIFSAPAGLLDLDSVTKAPGFDYISYWERKAKGGAASINVGECVVMDYDAGESRYELIRMKDRVHNYNGLSKLTDAISRNGAIATAELQHFGAASLKQGLFQLGPSDGRAPLNPEILRRAMTEEQIEQVIEEFVEAAAYAKDRGFGMVMLHAGHGWLLNQFFSPFFNQRTDKWGGSAENRARLTVTIVDRIHERCGKGFPVEVRISGAELFDGGYGVEGGIEFAKQLDGHADLIHVSAGNPYGTNYSSEWTHPGIFKDGGCNVWLAAEIKKHVSTPVATVGGLSDPDELEEIIASGKADVVEMARGLICDPDLPVKLRTGREKEVRKCLRCFNCITSMYSRGRLYCAINPESGKEREVLSLHSVPRKHVLVAGGGMAGMEAAITAAQNGHEVTLCEKAGELGGVLLCETGVYFKTRIGEHIERQKYMLEKLGVDVRLNTPVTPALVGEINPDALIVAIGGKPIRPNIPGIDGANVVSVEDAFANPDLVKGKALVIGAGRSGIELGIWLKEKGVDISLIEAKESGSAGNAASKVTKVGLEIVVNTKAKEIKADGVLCDTPDGEKFFAADTVVLALGVEPLWDEVDALSSFAGEFYQAGDCRAPRNIMAATGEGWTMANLVGRF